MKASDITDEQVLAVVDRIRGNEDRPTLIWDLQSAFPDFPYKVILAKMHQMVRKKRIEGCACGCRGDFRRIDRPEPYNPSVTLANIKTLIDKWNRGRVEGHTVLTIYRPE